PNDAACSCVRAKVPIQTPYAVAAKAHTKAVSINDKILDPITKVGKPNIGNHQIPVDSININWNIATNIKADIFPNIFTSKLPGIIRSLRSIPLSFSRTKFVPKGITIKNIAKMVQAGTLCCTVFGLINVSSCVEYKVSNFTEVLVGSIFI